MREAEYRRAPAGFTRSQWETFQRDGILIVKDALTDDEIATYLAGIHRVHRAEGSTRSDGFFSTQNFIEKDPVFASLIDHPRHVGFVYDLFGEQLKLQLSELFIRPPGAARLERWHYDGPRALPYAVFSQAIPLQVKVGYWLTDLSAPEMGNFMYVPGSHRQQYFAAYDTYDAAPGEVSLTVPRGAMTLFHCSLWHRTAPNNSATTRQNLYLGYCPSWIPSYDRVTSDPTWLATLTREQRIIMRSYADSYSHARPPGEDFPLFLDRDTGRESDPGTYGEVVPLRHRKRTTAAEKFTSQRSE